MLKSFIYLQKLGEFVSLAREREGPRQAELHESIRERDAADAREPMRNHLRVSKTIHFAVHRAVPQGSPQPRQLIIHTFALPQNGLHRNNPRERLGVRVYARAVMIQEKRSHH